MKLIRIMFCILLTITLISFTALSQEKVSIEDEVNTKRKTALDTKATLESVFAEVVKGPKNRIIEDEIKDASNWKTKGDKLLEKCEKLYVKKKFTKELVLDLEKVWQYYVKAATAGLRAQMMQKRIKG